MIYPFNAISLLDGRRRWQKNVVSNQNFWIIGPLILISYNLVKNLVYLVSYGIL